jgi:hypothetical protein
MNFLKEASKLLTNKYFLYFIVFLSASNVLGYLVTNKIHAVIFFALVAFLSYSFSKNMTVVLLIAMVSTNLLMSNKSIREGLENNTKKDDEKMADVDPDIKKGMNAIKNSKTVKDAKVYLENSAESDVNNTNIILPPSDPNNTDMNQPIDESNVPEPLTNASNKSSNKKSSGRIDYASTLEEAYDNLDKMLGSKGIQQLTTDTKDLMKKQQELFQTMQNMTPMLENAKSMLDGFDMKDLGGLSNLAKSLTSTASSLPKLN